MSQENFVVCLVKYRSMKIKNMELGVRRTQFKPSICHLIAI